MVTKDFLGLVNYCMCFNLFDSFFLYKMTWLFWFLLILIHKDSLIHCDKELLGYNHIFQSFELYVKWKVLKIYSLRHWISCRNVRPIAWLECWLVSSEEAAHKTASLSGKCEIKSKQDFMIWIFSKQFW